MLAKREGIVAAHADFVHTNYIHNIFKCFGIMDQGIYPELAEVMAGIDIIIDGAEIGADEEAMLYTADGERKAATAVGESYTEIWEATEDTTEDHGTDSPCCFGRHAYQPGEPVLLHIALPHHLPGVDEEGAAEFLGGLPERIEIRVAEVFAIDVGANFQAGHI